MNLWQEDGLNEGSWLLEFCDPRSNRDKGGENKQKTPLELVGALGKEKL